MTSLADFNGIFFSLSEKFERGEIDRTELRNKCLEQIEIIRKIPNILGACTYNKELDSDQPIVAVFHQGSSNLSLIMGETGKGVKFYVSCNDEINRLSRSKNVVKKIPVVQPVDAENKVKMEQEIMNWPAVSSYIPNAPFNALPPPQRHRSSHKHRSKMPIFETPIIRIPRKR